MEKPVEITGGHSFCNLHSPTYSEKFILKTGFWVDPKWIPVLELYLLIV